MKYPVAEGGIKSEEEMRAEYEAVPFDIKHHTSFENWCTGRKIWRTDIKSFEEEYKSSTAKNILSLEQYKELRKTMSVDEISFNFGDKA